VLSGMPLSRRTVLAVCSDTSGGRETHAQFVLVAEDLATPVVGPEGGDGRMECWLEAASPPRSAAVRLHRAEAARALCCRSSTATVPCPHQPLLGAQRAQMKIALAGLPRKAVLSLRLTFD
jgi:hypothetical protein